MKRTYLWVLIPLLLIASYVIILFVLSFDQAIYLTIEDGLTETLSVIFALISACIFFYLFFKSRVNNEFYFKRIKRNYFFLLLGIFCLFIVGEEINWGQRILGVEAPEWILEKESNEMNLHNIDTLFTVLGVRITAGRLYFAFVILYFMFLPILYSISKKTRNIVNQVQLPVIPLMIAIFFLINFFLFQVINKVDYPDGYNIISFGQTNMEVYEINFTILLLWASISFSLKKLK